MEENLKNKKLTIINGYEIEFYVFANKFELVNYYTEPKKDKTAKKLICEGSMGHEYPSEPVYEYYFYTSSEEKYKWYLSLKETVKFINKYCKNIKIDKVDNLVLNNLLQAIEANKK